MQKKSDGSNFFTGDTYDIIGEWQIHNFAAIVTGYGAIYSNALNLKELTENLRDYHNRSVHVDIGENINAEKRELVRVTSLICKWVNKVATMNIAGWF